MTNKNEERPDTLKKKPTKEQPEPKPEKKWIRGDAKPNKTA